MFTHSATETGNDDRSRSSHREMNTPLYCVAGSPHVMLYMAARLAEMQKQWSIKSDETLDCGIGITTGEVILVI